MFCSNCGKPVDGEKTLCDECAVNQTAVPTEDTPEQVEAAPIEEIPVQPELVVFPTIEETPAVKPPKKKKKVGLIIAIVAVVLAALGTAAYFLFPGIKDKLNAYVDRQTLSPQEYLVKVEGDAINAYIDDFTEAYGKALSAKPQNSGKVELGLTMGDDLITLLETTLQQQGTSMEMDWLKDIQVIMDTTMDDELVQVQLGLGLGKNNTLSVDVIMDAANGGFYMGAPAVNEAYLYADMSGNPSYAQMGPAMESIDTYQELYQDMLKDMPSEEDMNAMLKAYVSVILSSIEDVEQEEDTITVNGVDQKVVILKAKITEKDLLKIAKNILEKAEDDETLEQLLTAFGDYANEVNRINGTSYGDVDLYAELIDAIPYALESLEEAKEEASSKNYIKLNAYVDMDGNLRGHDLTVYTDGKKEIDTLSWLTAVDGDTVYTEAELAEVTIVGEKTEKKDVSSGSYTLTVDGMEIGTLEFEDVTETEGTLRLIPSEDLLDEALSGSDLPVSMFSGELALELSYDESSCEVSILVGPKALIGLSLSAKTSSGSSVSIPDNFVDSANTQEIEQWLANVDLSAVTQFLEKAGAPDELLSAVDSYAQQLESSFAQIENSAY